MNIAQEYLNAWGRKKYGHKYGMDAIYTVDLSAGYTYYSTLTGGDSYTEFTVYADGKEIAELTDANFTNLLNEILESKA
jgi:hypothetical protein